ncbi:MAG: alanine--glyoxylate aminotransferase family protein [Proteobacteria bacterium]|nr:alanine--glyoxylate aminotransferase family protein [Pseudomonadota bacterium]
MYTKQRLYCPGPTQVPEPSVYASSQGLCYHRTKDFEHDFYTCCDMLKPLFGCTELPVILSCSGTGAMDAAMSHITSPGDAVLVIEGGKFGQRWQQMAQAYQLKVFSLQVPWGKAPETAALLDTLKTMPSPPKAVFFQATETSTAVDFDVAAITKALHNHHPEIYVVVDAITALGARKMCMEEWGVDIMLSGSQKGFGVPPGLAFLAMSKRAWHKQPGHSRFYFDLHKEKAGQSKGRSSWTPAVTLLAALKSSLKLMANQGLENVYMRHRLTSVRIREALQMMGLKLFTADEVGSVSLTSFYVPHELSAEKILNHLQQNYGVVFAGGQGPLKGKIMRLSHLGFYDTLDMISAMAALEMTLKDLGFSATSALSFLADGLRLIHTSHT